MKRHLGLVLGLLATVGGVAFIARNHSKAHPRTQPTHLPHEDARREIEPAIGEPAPNGDVGDPVTPGERPLATQSEPHDARVGVGFVYEERLFSRGRQYSRSMGKRTAQSLPGKPLHVWDEGGGILRLVFSPDGKYLASATAKLEEGFGHPRRVSGRRVSLWDLSSSERVFSHIGDHELIRAVAFHPGGGSLAIGGHGGEIRSWSVPAGKEERSLLGHSRPVTTIAFSPAGDVMASGDIGGTVRLWDVTSGTSIREIVRNETMVARVQFDAEGKMFVCVTADGRINAWDTGTWIWQPDLNARLGNSGLLDCALTSNLSQATWLGPDSRATFLSSLPKEQPREFKPARLNANCVAITHDGSLLAVGTDGGGSICVWQLPSGKVHQTMTGLDSTVWSLAFSADGRRLGAGFEDSTIAVWSLGDESTTPKR